MLYVSYFKAFWTQKKKEGGKRLEPSHRSRQLHQLQFEKQRYKATKLNSLKFELCESLRGYTKSECL